MVSWDPFGTGNPPRISYAATTGLIDPTVPYDEANPDHKRCRGAFSDISRGVPGGGRLRGFASIHDDPAKTVMIAEKLTVSPFGSARCGDAFGWFSGKQAGTVPDTVRSGFYKPAEPRGSGSSSGLDDCPDEVKGFGLLHNGGLNVLFVDGHVKWIPGSIDLVTWQEMNCAQDEWYPPSD
ncbi:MAG: H-X9-DG-CTERM domain-containing protein [Pirellulales bacterium]